MKNKIIVHCLVKNEENFIWYALNSVLPFVDKIMVWDNGSTDKTVEIIKSINSPKVTFESHPINTRQGITDLRQKMLDMTSKEFDWLLVLDGDEIWPKASLSKIIKFISKNPNTESIVTWTTNLVGDIYHALPKTSGNYNMAGKTGQLNLRFINLKNIPGLHVSKPYGQEGYYDKGGKLIQDRNGVVFIDTSYVHATHLLRSSSEQHVFDRSNKFKLTLGEKIDEKDFPSVLLEKPPIKIRNVKTKMCFSTWLICILITFVSDLKQDIKSLIYAKA